MKYCNGCGLVKDSSAFHRHAKSPDGLKDRCKLCRAQEYLAREKSKQRLRLRGWTEEAFSSAWLSQKGLCAICKCTMMDGAREMNSACADHCHSTLKTRAIICRGCNSGLGQFLDNPATMRKAADYVEFFRGQV